MDTVQLLTLGLAILILAAVFRRSRSAADWPRLSPAVPTIEVSDPTIARRMLIEHADRFSNLPVSPFPVEFVTGPRAVLSHSISTVPHGPLWRALRCNLTAGILHPSRLGLLTPIQRDAVEGLVGVLGSMMGAEVVLRDSLHTAVLTLQVRLCFGDGVDERDVRAVQRVLHDFFDSMVSAGELASSRVARLLHWRKWRRLLGIRERMAALLLPLIAARQQRRQLLPTGSDGGICPYVDSLLDLQVPAHDGASTKRALTDGEMVTLVWEFLDAGTETVVSCVEWTLAHLVTQPEVQNMLHHELAGDNQSERQLRELPLMRAVILESLRLHPPVAFLEREVGADGAAVVGATIPSGSTQMRFRIITRDIGRDDKAWTDADEFLMERFCTGGDAELVGPMPGPKEIRMMPFGAGTRHCPGEGLGMVHVWCFLAALVREFRWEPPVGGGRVDLTEQAGFVTHLKTPLRARITPRI